MSIDFISNIQLSVDVYIKEKTSLTEKTFFIGSSHKCLNQEEFEKLLENLNLKYNKDYECLEEVFCSISGDYDSCDFIPSELEEAKTSLLKRLQENGIDIDNSEIGFELIYKLC